MNNNWFGNFGLNRLVKYVCLLLLLLVATVYALPNFYGDDPAVQILSTHNTQIPPTVVSKVNTILANNQLTPKASGLDDNGNLLLRFRDTDSQLKAKDLLHQDLSDDYVVALHLASAAPAWFAAIGAHPMRLGLDLRGGVHLTLDVDTQDLIKRSLDADKNNMMQILRENNIHYSALVLRANQDILVQFRDSDALNEAYTILKKQFPNYQLNKEEDAQIVARLSLPAQQVLTSQVVEQTMTTLRNRVNELGVSEAIVQQQGMNRVSVDLPGIQDSARAKEILGGTATVEFRLVDQGHDATAATTGAQVPFGSQLYVYEGRPVLLQKQVILYGKAITDARSTYAEDGTPAVSIQLGSGEALFNKVTRSSIGQFLATVYVETKAQTKMVNGQEVKVHQKQERVINVARIREALGRNFQVSGLESDQAAQNLAILLRAGALPANIDIVEERVVGPKLGIENIQRGMMSLAVGVGAIILFMMFYYRVFGILANIALCLNLIFLTALLSLLGATLTFPGIAAMVLTVGIAVDASVLIFERIREELRNGISPMGSIKTGFERAMVTIIDANLTTFIVAFLLFSIGAGAVKGFAIVLSLGLLTSMLTAITYTRTLADLVYNRPGVKKLSIGI